MVKRTVDTSFQSVTAFAPTTCANVAVGFDILGFAFGVTGDTVTCSPREDNQVVITSIDSKYALPFETKKNTASVVVEKCCQDLNLKTGFSLEIKKGIPLSSGMGGSAACAVAALVALNAFIKPALSLEALAQYALLGEKTASGQAHADNLVPCLWGGFTLVPPFGHSSNMEVINLPVPALSCVLIHPHCEVSTKSARKILKKNISLKNHVEQSGYLAGFISALYQKDFQLLQKSLQDVVIEPQRAKLIPGFDEMKKAAMNNGALGFSLSGSGPSVFAFAHTEKAAKKIAAAVQLELKKKNIGSDVWISPLTKTCTRGARVIKKIKKGT